jgi:hypothetical protein
MVIPHGFDKLSGDPPPAFGDIFGPVLRFLFQEVQYSGETPSKRRMRSSGVVEPAMETLGMIRTCANAFRPAHLPECLGIESVIPNFRQNVEVRGEGEGDSENGCAFVLPQIRDLARLIARDKDRGCLAENGFKCLSRAGKEQWPGQYGLSRPGSQLLKPATEAE